ncbi:hypothetical protein CRG98_046593, partial [Punica granatum]
MAENISPLFVLSLVFFILISLTSSSPSLSLPPRLWPPRFLGQFSRKPASSNRLRLQQYRYDVRYFEQPLDHFSFSAEAPTFRQRYLISSDHWAGPERMAPIFLYCGNEGDIEWFAQNTGFVWEIAPKFGAMVLFPEHRYYGESLPFGSRDEANKNSTTLKYLTAEQALADFAVLVTNLKRNLSAEACPVVLFGGSYGG